MNRRLAGGGLMLVGIAVSLVGGSCSAVEKRNQPISPEDSGVVVVTLSAVAPEDGCARVEPEEVTVWRPGREGRPQQVEWVVSDPGSHHWTIERDLDKPGGDFFGRRHVPCQAGPPSVRSGPPANLPPRGDARWGYRVVLRQCGEPDGEPLCVVDPTIIIKDW